VLRSIAARLRRGVQIPFLGLDCAIDVRRRNSKISVPAIEQSKSAPQSVEHAIVAHHIDTLIARCQALARFHHIAVATNHADALAFLDFCNDAVSLFDERAREVQVRRLLTALVGRVKSPQFREQTTRRIAESDLRSGVVERALILKDDPALAQQVSVALDEYDKHYGAPEGFLRAIIKNLELEGDARGRTLAYFFSLNGEILRGKRVLHVAPESALRAFFDERGAELGCDYSTLDGFSRETTYQADLSRIPLADGSFDIVICHRVLEHVMDDWGAIGELYRILAPNGLLNVSVPQSMNCAETNEWLSADSSHHMHVRQYGRDFEDRLRAAGFDVTVERTILEMPMAAHRAAQTFPMRHYLCRKSDGAAG
jgi:SAM-dependent methyltransferase